MAVLVWFQLGYPVVIFMAALQRADPQLAEAAEIDGASWWQRLWRITVPQIRPEIYVVLLTCTVASLRVFGWIFALTNGGPGTADSGAVLLLIPELLHQPRGGVRLGHRHRDDRDHHLRVGGLSLGAAQERGVMTTISAAERTRAAAEPGRGHPLGRPRRAAGPAAYLTPDRGHRIRAYRP